MRQRPRHRVAARHQQAAFAVDDAREQFVDLFERIGLTRLVIASEGLVVLMIDRAERGQGQFRTAHGISLAQGIDPPLLRAVLRGFAIEQIELIAGARPLIGIKLAKLLVAADDIAAKRRLGIGHRPRQIAGEDHHLVTVRLQVERAITLTISRLECEDQRDQHGRTQHRRDHQHDGPPVRDRALSGRLVARAHCG